VLAVGFVGAAAIGGAFYWDRVALRGEQAARAELPQLAAEQLPRMYTYDYQTVERTHNEIYPLLTPTFREEFKQLIEQRGIISQARERQVVSQAHVVGVGVMQASRSAASVLVYLNHTTTDKSKEPVYQGSRVRVDYKKVDGKWLIDNVTPI